MTTTEETTSASAPTTTPAAQPIPAAIPSPHIRIGTRRSALAVVQAEHFLDIISTAHPSLTYEIVAMATMGDKNQITPLHNFGAKALWTHELEHDLLTGDLDMVVHCTKDMPTQLPPDCVIGAILDRVDARDALIMKAGVPYRSLAELPDGSVVGTSSVRRSAQIKRHYPRLCFKDVRGNLNTRFAKLDAPEGEYTCLILAAAGVHRLGWGARITQFLDSKTPGGGMLYAVGQGALAVEVRKDDTRMLELLAKIEDRAVSLACQAERSLMRTLEGGCSVPIGVESEWADEGRLLMRAIVCSLDGRTAAEADRLAEVSDEAQADDFGWQLAQELVRRGADKILGEIALNRDVLVEGGNA